MRRSPSLFPFENNPFFEIYDRMPATAAGKTVLIE